MFFLVFGKYAVQARRFAEGIPIFYEHLRGGERSLLFTAAIGTKALNHRTNHLDKHRPRDTYCGASQEKKQLNILFRV
jgi:hypothetical protein